jgi:hypothetical protein
MADTRSPELTEVELAKILNGPFYKLPPDSKYTLEELREVRWGMTGEQLRGLLRQQARAAIEALSSKNELPSEIEAGDCPPHCCCCDHYEPCCDCGEVMPGKACIGEKCWCGAPAAKKVGEEILFDDPCPERHNLTSYVCARHYAQLMGPLGAKQVGLAALNPKDTDTGSTPLVTGRE